MTAELGALMSPELTRHEGRSATEAAHIEVISERLRLLYVGLMRARRFLHISRSRKTRKFRKEYDSEPATAMAVLYRYITGELSTEG